MGISYNLLLKDAFANAASHVEIIKYRLGWPPSEHAQQALIDAGYRINLTYDVAQEMRDIGEEVDPLIPAPHSDGIDIRTRRGEIIEEIADPARRKSTFKDVRHVIAEAYRRS